jgi:hypothetical protein
MIMHVWQRIYQEHGLWRMEQYRSNSEEMDVSSKSQTEIWVWEE